MALTIEQRITRIEKASGSSVPGTQIIRSLPDSGLEWTVAIGGMMQPKRQWSAKTISKALSEAENFFKLK